MFFKQSDLLEKRIDDNSFRTVLAYGDGLMNAFIRFEKGLPETTEVPFHHHEHVQTTYVLKGKFKFSIQYPEGIRTEIVAAGDAIYFPSNLLHGCIPLVDDSQLLDSFTPIREDFL